MGKKIVYPDGIEYPDLKNKTGIYVITNVLDGKQYVGQSKNIEKRWYDHRTKSIHPRKLCEYNKELYQAIRRDGLENFYIQILEECAIDALNEKEIYWINKLDTFNNGYNNDYGGKLPCYTKEHHLTDHGKAKLTVGDVRMCREAYRQGKSARAIYNQYYSNKISWGGFLNMWHGRNWKEIMPEVFEKNPRPRVKVTPEDVIKIREYFDSGEGCRKIHRRYKGKLGYCTIYNIAHRKTYIDGIHYSSDVSTIPEGSNQSIDTVDETDVSE